MDEQKYVNAEALKAARKRSGHSQQKLADRIEVNRRAIVVWERPSKDGRNPIQEKNLLALARELKVPVKNLTEPPQHQDTVQKITAKISPNARYAYDVIQYRHGVSRDALMEAAPLLFEAMHQIFLDQRRGQLESLEAQSETFCALVPGLAEELLEGERKAIERREAFTPSHFEDPNYHQSSHSNRFTDQLLNIPLPADQVSIDMNTIMHPTFPDYIMGSHGLAKLLGIGPDDQPTEDQCKAGYAVVYGHAQLNDLPKDLSPPDLVAWIITQIPEQEASGEFDWNPGSPYDDGLPHRGRARWT